MNKIIKAEESVFFNIKSAQLWKFTVIDDRGTFFFNILSVKKRQNF